MRFVQFQKVVLGALFLSLLATILTVLVAEPKASLAVTNAANKCLNTWGGDWAPAPGGTGAGTCTIPDFTKAPNFSASTETPSLMCKKFRMIDVAEDGTLDDNHANGPCRDSSDVIAQEIWITHNFDYSSPAYTRKVSPTHGIWNIAVKKNPEICGVGSNSLDMHLDTINWTTTGDFCVPLGRKLKANLDYTSTVSGDFYEDCETTYLNCGCGAGFAPLGTTYEYDGTNILDGAQKILTTSDGDPNTTADDRVQNFNISTHVEGGQCINEKIVKCLTLEGSESFTQYKIINSEERCIIPGTTPTTYLWVNGAWSQNACSPGQKLRSDGSGICDPCTSPPDEGSTACCQNTSKMWHSGDNMCYPPRKYECEVMIKKPVFSLIPDVYTGYSYAGKAPSALYQSTNGTCRVSCLDVEQDTPHFGFSAPIYNAPGPMDRELWRWKQFGNTLRLAMNGSSAPYFTGSVTTGSQCDWECVSGYAKSGTTCVQSDVPDPTPTGDVTYDATNFPDEVIHPGVNVRNYDALVKKTPDDWEDGNDYFLSPGKDNAEVDIWLRFQILKDGRPDEAGKPETINDGTEIDPSNDGGEILRWRIEAKDTNGNLRTLTSLPGCFNDSLATPEGSSLCLDHLRGVQYIEDEVVEPNVTATHLQAAIKNPHGRDSFDGSTVQLEDFLQSVQYPVLKLEYTNAPINKFGHRIPIEYQIFVKAPISGPVNLSSGTRILKIIGEIGGVKTVLNARVGGKELAPFLNYVISVR